MRFVLGLIAAACVTQAANAKIYKGKVVDASTKEPLIGATVEVSGTSMGTVTDIDGCFTIDCKDGAKLTVKYVSYKTSSTIASDGMTVQMSPDSQTLGEVTVAARKRQNLDSSVLEAARNGLTMQSGVSAQQIRRTQDKDASEVIRRVPGISIIDDKFVMVRGLSQRYNNVWINGSAVPSSEADSRAFSFDIIPSSQLDNLMIVKSPAPEYPADFSGGFILINTKDIPEQNGFSLSLGGNINEKTHFRNFLHSKGSATDFLGFDNGMRNFNGGINGQLRPTTGGVDLNGNGFNNDWTRRRHGQTCHCRLNWLACGASTTERGRVCSAPSTIVIPTARLSVWKTPCSAPTTWSTTLQTTSDTASTTNTLPTHDLERCSTSSTSPRRATTILS